LKDLGGEIKRFRDKFNQLSVDACVVVAMSHGIRDELEMVDGKMINFWNKIIYEFHPDNCPKLENKPKVFMINSCQFFYKKTEAPIDADIDRLLPQDYSDILVVVSALPGYPSYRNKRNGTQFIGNLVNIFQNHACNMEIQKMLKLVSLVKFIFDEIPLNNILYRFW
jgi:hypothetical protein